MTRLVRGSLLVALAVSGDGCVFHRVGVRPVEPADQIDMVGPVKAHLRDGSTVVYAPGVSIIVTGQTLRGAGMRYNYALTETTRVDSVPLEMVVGMERFETEVNRPATIAASIAASYAAIMGFVFLMFAVAVQGH